MISSFSAPLNKLNSSNLKQKEDSKLTSLDRGDAKLTARDQGDAKSGSQLERCQVLKKKDIKAALDRYAEFYKDQIRSSDAPPVIKQLRLIYLQALGEDENDLSLQDLLKLGKLLYDVYGQVSQQLQCAFKPLMDYLKQKGKTFQELQTALQPKTNFSFGLRTVESKDSVITAVVLANKNIAMLTSPFTLKIVDAEGKEVDRIDFTSKTTLFSLKDDVAAIVNKDGVWCIYSEGDFVWYELRHTPNQINSFISKMAENKDGGWEIASIKSRISINKEYLSSVIVVAKDMLNAESFIWILDPIRNQQHVFGPYRGYHPGWAASIDWIGPNCLKLERWSGTEYWNVTNNSREMHFKQIRYALTNAYEINLRNNVWFLEQNHISIPLPDAHPHVPPEKFGNHLYYYDRWGRINSFNLTNFRELCLTEDPEKLLPKINISQAGELLSLSNDGKLFNVIDLISFELEVNKHEFAVLINALLYSNKSFPIAKLIAEFHGGIFEAETIPQFSLELGNLRVLRHDLETCYFQLVTASDEFSKSQLKMLEHFIGSVQQNDDVQKCVAATKQAFRHVMNLGWFSDPTPAQAVLNRIEKAEEERRKTLGK